MIEYYLTSPVQYRPKFSRIHTGIDIAFKGETVPVYPILPGKVVYVNKTNEKASGGFAVYVESHAFTRSIDNKVVSITLIQHYYHFSLVNVDVGDTILYDTILGIQGNTGSVSTGPHVHIDLVFKRNDVPVSLFISPFMLRYIKEDGKSYYANASRFKFTDNVLVALPNIHKHIAHASVLFQSQKLYKYLPDRDSTSRMIGLYFSALPQQLINLVKGVNNGQA